MCPAPLSDHVARLLDLPKYGKGIGLRRMLLLCSDLFREEWFASLDAIKVTGSNGKGSVAAMTSSILRSLGLCCGCYTSPHLWSFHERIALDGKPIPDADLQKAVRWYSERSADVLREHPSEEFGRFEAITAVALYHYAQCRPDVLVAEAGVGGRYDSTRIIPGSLAALASLDLEHADVLGSTLELIAFEKADLCPEGGTLVAGAMDRDLFERLTAYCSLRGIQVISAPAACRVAALGYEDSRMAVDLEFEGRSLRRCKMGLGGVHQLSNAAVATVLSRLWLNRHRPGLSQDAFFAGLAEGLESVQWPGRFQKIVADPEIYIDVGHSPDAVRCLAATVRNAIADRPILLVTGVSRNKPAETIVAQLAGIAEVVICTRAYHNGSDVAVIAAAARRHRPGAEIHESPTVEQAVALARSIAVRRGMTILVAGSLFLAVEVERAWKGLDPRSVRFF